MGLDHDTGWDPEKDPYYPLKVMAIIFVVFIIPLLLYYLWVNGWL